MPFAIHGPPGSRETMDKEKSQECYDGRLRELGEVSFGRIEIKPFSVERFDTVFGLIAREPEDEDLQD